MASSPIAPQEELVTGEEHDLSGEAAGVVRGVSRSLVRAPLIGRLPVHAPAKSARAATSGRALLRRRLPVRRVARVTDRVSTGIDWYTSALESSSADQPKFWSRFRSVATNLLRNTLLGMAVFESYGYTVSYFSPDPDRPTVGVISTDEHSLDVSEQPHRLVTIDDESDEVVSDEPDEYARASLSVHFGAGLLAGSIHGIASSVMERPTTQVWRNGMLQTLHHSVAHSLLFGSYEGVKRLLFHNMLDEGTPYFGPSYAVIFGIAGGLAGQVQHVASHYAEEILGLTNETLQIRFRPSIAAPTLRPLLWAFPPSAIGFVAFEYGKTLTTDNIG